MNSHLTATHGGRQSESLQKLNHTLHFHLARLLGVRENELGFLLDHIESCDASDPMASWQTDSLIERYSKNFALDLGSILSTRIRDGGWPQFDLTWLRCSPDWAR